MAGMSGRRQAAVGAFAVVALWLIGLFLSGKPPRFGDPPEQVVDYYSSHHKQVLIAVILVAIGIAVLLLVISQLAVPARSGQRSRAGRVLVAGAAMMGLSVGDALYGIAQAVVVPGRRSRLAMKALYMLDQSAGIIRCTGSAAPLRLRDARSQARSLPAWALWFSGPSRSSRSSAALLVKADGVFAAGTGLFATLGFGAALLFLLEVGILLGPRRKVTRTRSRRRRTRPRRLRLRQRRQCSPPSTA
jgi:hypothetical protein